MDLDRGTLAKIDRGLLAQLEHEERYQTARIPASDALWAAWRRYCKALGLSMGRGIVALIVHELGATDQADGQVLAPELEERLLVRAQDLDARERWLAERERRVKQAERRLRFQTMPLPQERLRRRSQRPVSLRIRLQVQAMPRPLRRRSCWGRPQESPTQSRAVLVPST